ASANGVTLRIPARHYRFTKSINGGKANANDFHTLRIIGEGFYSKLVADLTEAYPAIDLTNQRDGCIEYLGFDSTTTSLHTCMFLMAETTPSFVNGFRFNFCQAVDEGASSHYLLYGLSADQMMIDNCNWITLTTAGAACVYVGPLNPYSISSKFWTIIETSADLTVFSAHNSNFLAASGPALWLQEIIGIQLTNTYFGVIGTTGHAMGMLRIGSNGAGYSTQVVCTNFRTEDHASGGTTLAQVTGAIAPTGDGMTSTLTATATTTGAIAVGMVLTGTGVKSGTVVLANVSTNVWLVSNIQTVASGTLTSQVYSSPAIYFEDYVRESILQGQASTIGAGAIGGPGQQINTTASIGCTFGLFNNAGALLGGRFHCYGSSGLGGQGYGGLFDQVNSHSYVIGGDLGGAAAAIPAYAATASEFSDFGTNEPGAGTPHKYLNYQTRVFAPGGNTPVNYRIAVQGESGVYNAFNGGTYTGGSGMVQMGGPLISAAFLRYNAASSSDLVYPAREIIIEGMFNSNWAAAGQMRVDLQQTPASGTKYTTLCTLTGIPAYGAATGYRITISCYWNGSGWFLHTKIETFGSAPVSAVNIMGITSQGFDATSSAPLLVIPFLSNAGNTPVTYATFYKVV
ncbi:hypothetical protein, partial [Telmatospirillum sp.]|uniref:hypothetical protein n=1 Tax=Telmatospirillum sp. TaxID=2079197 RepID=UPI0028515F95